MAAPPFVHLHVHGPFSRMSGASSADALCARAAALGMEALALTDQDTLSGAVPFLQACRRHGLQPILGAEVTLAGGAHLLLLAPDSAGYAALCRLLSAAHLEHPRNAPEVSRGDLEAEAPHLLALSGGRDGAVGDALLRRRPAAAVESAAALAALFPGRFYLELPADRLPGNRFLIRQLQGLAERLRLPTVATGDVHYATKGEAWISDLLACVRLGCDLAEMPPERAPQAFNAERYLKDAAEVALAVGDPRACARTAEIAERCAPALTLGGNRYPRFPLPGGEEPVRALRRQVVEGAAWRHGTPVPPAVRDRLEYELGIIFGLGFADYFLCVADVVRWARRQGIRVAGRGSAADSAVAYALSITDVDAAARGHLFERFLSEERAEAPDIDLDFDARHRDRVADYVIGRYGQERVAAVAAHNTWSARSAVRALGKAMGFPLADLDRFAKRIPYYTPPTELRAALAEVPELAVLPARRLEALASAVGAVAGLPRHLATHLGGLCITPGPVTDVMPVQRSAKGVVVAQFDKRDLEALGLLKLDLLSLRTLGAVDDSLRLAARWGRPVDYARIPEDDAATFARLRRGETVGVFQLESAAQQALQVRLGASELEDVIASVALIRPGPIQGNMVDPFVARRRGREPVSYPHPGLEGILRRTHGVVVYQEQVIAIATAIAGFTPGESDRLRRVMSHARSPLDMEEIGGLFCRRAAERGVDADVARDIFACLQGYASYGFPEAHAVAFGVTAYRTAYLAEHRPAAYFAGILDNQPMGFYPVHTLVTELRRRGVRVLGPDVQRSGLDWGAAASAGTLRAPLGAVSGVPEGAARAIVDGREREGRYKSLFDLCRRVPAVPLDALEALILAGACDAWAGDCGGRRQLLWSLSGIRAAARSGGMPLMDPPRGMRDFSLRELWLQEQRLLGFSPRGHVLEMWRARLEEQGYMRSGQARCAPDGMRLSVAGVPVRPHRPPTRSGRRLVFLALEDEEGLVEVMVPEDVYRRAGAILFPSRPLLGIAGRVRRRGNGMSLVAEQVLVPSLRTVGAKPLRQERE